MEEALVLIEEKSFRELREMLCEWEPADIASLLATLPDDRLVVIFRLLPKEIAAEVFVEMDADAEELLIGAYSDSELREVINLLFMDDTVDIIEEMPANVVSRMLKAVSPDKRLLINELLKYPESTAGSVMTTEYIVLRADMTVDDAMKRIRRTGISKETVYTCYVTDPRRRLIGYIDAVTLMIADPDELIGDLMETSVISAKTTDNKEDTAADIQKYDLLALPVVDGENRLVGIITVDDAIDVITEANEDDFAIMSAMQPIEETYFKTPVLTHAKNRIIWLVILMLSASISGIIITHYENTFATVPILVSFIPMLMNTGGNCGSQSSTMIIRGLATDEISPSDFLRALFKEFRIGVLIGAALFVVGFVQIMIQQNDLRLALTVGLTLVCSAMLAKLLGCTLPILAKILKLDPAIMASPFITTIVDCFTVFVYFNIALVVMNLSV